MIISWNKIWSGNNQSTNVRTVVSGDETCYIRDMKWPSWLPHPSTLDNTLINKVLVAGMPGSKRVFFVRGGLFDLWRGGGGVIWNRYDSKSFQSPLKSQFVHPLDDLFTHPWKATCTFMSSFFSALIRIIIRTNEHVSTVLCSVLN